ncbi:MAG TPA: adenylate kinase [Chloroflexota bacterium]|nr:adenylate kinase [Chloroflexota bacterium]
MDIVFMGPPGAGKGTQAKALAAELGIAHIATGDLFREAARRDTPLGREARAYMERGELVPDALTVAMLLERLAEPDAARGALLDGFPRTLAQAEQLDAALAAQGRRVDKAVYLVVPRETLLRRLSGRWLCERCQAVYHEVYHPPATPGRCDQCGGQLYQRPDDRRETAERRLDVYLEQTVPVIEYYRRKGLLVEVNGDQTIEAVQHALRQALRDAAGR